MFPYIQAVKELLRRGRQSQLLEKISGIDEILGKLQQLIILFHKNFLNYKH